MPLRESCVAAADRSGGVTGRVTSDDRERDGAGVCGTDGSDRPSGAAGGGPEPGVRLSAGSGADDGPSSDDSAPDDAALSATRFDVDDDAGSVREPAGSGGANGWGSSSGVSASAPEPAADGSASPSAVDRAASAFSSSAGSGSAASGEPASTGRDPAGSGNGSDADRSGGDPAGVEPDASDVDPAEVLLTATDRDRSGDDVEGPDSCCALRSAEPVTGWPAAPEPDGDGAERAGIADTGAGTLPPAVGGPGRCGDDPGRSDAEFDPSAPAAGGRKPCAALAWSSGAGGAADGRSMAIVGPPDLGVWSAGGRASSARDPAAPGAPAGWAGSAGGAPFAAPDAARPIQDPRAEPRFDPGFRAVPVPAAAAGGSATAGGPPGVPDGGRDGTACGAPAPGPAVGPAVLPEPAGAGRPDDVCWASCSRAPSGLSPRRSGGGPPGGGPGRGDRARDAPNGG